MSEKTKKALVWCAIIIIFVLVGGTFLKQFFGWDTWLEVKTNKGTITLPTILVSGFLFWFPIFVLGFLHDYLKERVEKLNKKSKKNKTA